MRIITNRSLTECWKKYPDAKPSLAVWEERICAAECYNHTELIKIFSNADYVPNQHFKYLTIFNIKGNEYRLAADVFFNTGHVFIKWFGNHADYDQLDFKVLINGGFRLC